MAYVPLATDKTNATDSATDHPTHHNDLAERVNDVHINVRTDCGATGDGSTDDTAAFVDAIAALPDGGVITVPASDNVYLVDADALDLDDTKSILIQGQGGRSGGVTPASTIKIASNGTYGISTRTTFGLAMRDLSVTYDSTFTGTLVRAGHSATALDSQLVTFDNCQFGDGTQTSAAVLFSLDRAANWTFNGCNFSGGTRAVKGRAGTNDSTQYSNMVRFVGCRFGGFVNRPVQNPGEGWTFIGCTFQQLTSTAPGAVDNESSCDAQALSFLGCGFYDSRGAVAGDKWIDMSAGICTGFVFIGNIVGHADTAIDLGSSSSTSATVLGNDFIGTYGTKRVNYTGSTSRAMILAGDTAGDTMVMDGAIVFKGVSSNFISARAQSSANNTMLAWSTGGANDTYRQFVSGAQEFGDGTAARDVVLSRHSANLLGIATDDAFSVGAGTGTGGSFVTFWEQSSDPSAPGGNSAKLFCKDNGAGKSQLCVRFNTGATQVIATEP